MKKLFSLFVLPLFFLSVLLSAKEAARLSNGKPSHEYWQQQADYSIKAELDVQKKFLYGSGVIRYYNNSPDTLHQLVWHLYQNIFRSDSSPRKNNEQTARVAGSTEGITVESLSVGGKELKTIIDETIMEAPLPQPLLPHSTIEIAVRWKYEIPKSAELRTGSAGNDFGICQWYPQIAVYDDQRGWDRTQYLGRAEFYLEYGNWNVEMTVPKNFVVAATGVLQNAADLLSPEQLRRLQTLSADSISHIILPSETSQSADSVSEEKQIWKFSAEQVRDFAWAASPNFVWDGTKTRGGVNIYAFYKAKDFRASFPLLLSNASNWNEGAVMAKHAIEFFSARYGAYIYPQATVVSGPVRGMEYPMFIFADDGDALSNSLELVIAHELGHEWYPMMIGSNETNYPFMDEGFNTYITSNAVTDYSGENGLLNKDFIKKYSWLNLPENNERIFEQRIYLNEARSGRGASILSHPYAIPNFEYGVMAYMKPGSVMVMLEDLLGTETFNAAMLEYYRRWKLKHPYPNDFFNTIEDVTGRDLDWFWHEWFEETWRLDLAVDNVRNEKHQSFWKTTVTLENKEQAVMPATLRLTLADGSSRDVRFSETLFDRGNKADFVIDSLPAKVTNVVIDPKMMLADVNRLNNSWNMPRIEFDYGLNLLNALLPPLDAYRINFAPAVGFNLRDGFEIGTSINGSYLATDHNFTLNVKEGIRSGVPDYELSYSTPLRIFDPELVTEAKFFRLDGFTGGTWNMKKTFLRQKSILGRYRRSLTITTNFLSIRINDRRYLGSPADWDLKGRLDAGFITLQYAENFPSFYFFAGLNNEFSIPSSAYRYAKLSAETRIAFLLPFGIRVNGRLFAGNSGGVVPAQTAYSLTQASHLERFDEWLFRTPVFGQTFRSHFTKAGGGNVFLSHDTSAANIAAANVSLNFGNVKLFGDAGSLWDSTQTRMKQFFYDAGIAYQLSFNDAGGGYISLGGWEFGIYLPLWVKDPSRPKENEFAFRWNLVFGLRW
ncbi:MAG: M1 family metallopeptidase [Bacteroidetes bacterium]|nr:M1 family metallopeptidase [Bacteroidota bacterium]